MDLIPGGRAIVRFWYVVLAVAAISSIVAYAASFLQTPSYAAATWVLVRAKDIRFLTSTAADPNTRPGALDLAQPRSVSQTLGGIAISKPVAEQVVRELQLDQQPTSSSSELGAAIKRAVRALPSIVQYGYYAEPDPFDAAVALVQRSIEATPIKESYLIEIKARAAKPELAAQIANSATRAFVGQTRRSSQQDAAAYRVFLEGELERVQTEVASAESALSGYKQQKGLTDAAEASRLAAASAEALRQQIFEVDTELANARAKRASLQSTLAGLSPTERTTNTSIGQTSGTGNVGTVGGDSTQRQESVSPNRVYQDVQRSMLALDGDIGGLQAKRDALSSVLSSSSSTATALVQDNAQLNQLELQRATAHTTFASVRATYQSALMNEAQGAEEVRQIDQATAPLYPDRPVRFVFLFLGFLFGLAAGGALAYLIDRTGVRWTALLPARSGAAATSQPERQPAKVTSIVRGTSDDGTRPPTEPRRVASRYEL